jgi:hypothetical protein
VGALALAAGTLMASGPQVARANVDDPVHVGNTYSTNAATTIRRTTTGLNSGYDWTSVVMAGLASGVAGIASAAAPAGTAGVVGTGFGAGQYGVVGVNNAGTGTAIRGSSAEGTALEVQGVTRFSRSGIGQIAKGHSTCTITGLARIAASSIILVTLQGSAGTGRYVRYAARVSDSSFKVRLNKKAANTVAFGYFIIN